MLQLLSSSSSLSSSFYPSLSYLPCHHLSTSPTPPLLLHQCYIKYWTSLSSVVDNFYIIAVKSGMMQKPNIVKEMLAWIGFSTQEVDEIHKIQMGQWRQQCTKNCLCMELLLGLMWKCSSVFVKIILIFCVLIHILK